MSATFQRGDARPVMLPAALGKAVAEGDLAGFSGGTLVTPADTAWTSDLPTTQAAFVALFAGRAAQAKDANGYVYGNGEAFKLSVRTDTGGVCRYAAAAGTYVLGDYVGPAKDTGNALLNQTVAKVTVEAGAVGKVVGLAGTNPGYLEVELLSRVFRGASAT